MAKKKKSDIPFHYITVSTDDWQKVACRVMTSYLWLHRSPFDMVSEGDILVFIDEHNPYPRCICKVLQSRWFSGFKSAFDAYNKTAFGYIRGECISASYHDFADDYTLKDVRACGVVGISWKLLSCEYLKYTEETDPELAKPRDESEFDPEYDYRRVGSQDRAEEQVSSEYEAYVNNVFNRVSDAMQQAIELEKAKRGGEVVELPLSDEADVESKSETEAEVSDEGQLKVQEEDVDGAAVDGASA